LKLFKKETQKMSSFIWKGLLAIAVIIPTLAIGSQALADLRLGDQGDAVRNLQERLRINADGIYGQNTEDAVRVFQTDRGLTQDGIAGEETLRALGLDPNSQGELFFRAGESDLSGGPYRVVVPGKDEDNLSRAQQVVFGAKLSSDSRRGDYIDAGGYATRSEADEVARQLQDRNLDARVDFRRD